MDPLCDPLTTRPIQTGWVFTMEQYPSGQFGFIDDPASQFGNALVWTRNRTRSDGLETLLTRLVLSDGELHATRCPGDGSRCIASSKCISVTGLRACGV